MHFVSTAFWVFLPVVLALFWVLRGHWKWQNVVLLVASYFFYGWWDARFLLLIAGSTVVDFLVGVQLSRTPSERWRKAWLGVSLGFNLGMLGWFKYAGFLVDQWVSAWAGVGVAMDPMTVQVILPVGISFYTFQTLSYSIDVYRKRMEPCRDLVAFATYVAFFPQLVAGPIERATRLLPQMRGPRAVSATSIHMGWRLICWGIFKKVVIADSAAVYANVAFGETGWSGPFMVIGVVAFAVQIYGDFSGYSDIAIGTARLFGIRLRSNFRFPYFSRDLGEFWRRWHVSLNTWFRDYLYIPLGGSRKGRGRAVFNVAVVFLVSGLWHGADWKFVTWGAVHAVCFVPLFLTGGNRRPERVWHWSDVPRALWTFGVVCFAWVFFRADNLGHAAEVLRRIASDWGAEAPSDFSALGSTLFMIVLVGFVVLEWVQFRFGIRWLWRRWWRGPWVEATLVVLALFFGLRQASQEFIYFAF
jgi:alginate O-acetyltransferase complex protein AlgI